MSVNRTSNAAELIRRVCIEVGLTPIADPYTSTDPEYIRLTGLLNSAGEDLSDLYAWEFLTRTENFITVTGDSGDYDLPTDFLRMIPQTGWERSQQIPLGGPLSAQAWNYLAGRDLVANSIYASFRIQQGKFTLYPQPPVPDLDISYEYVSTGWVEDGQAPGTYKDLCTGPGDIPQFDALLIRRYLKVMYLNSKQIDSSSEQADFDQSFELLTGSDKSAPTLNAGGGGGGLPLLDMRYNTPDTRYGS